MTKSLDAATIAAIRASAPAVGNGTFTITHPERGHYTVKLWTALNGALAGKRLLGLLTGPDNERDFTATAFWDDEKRVVNVWKRFRSISSSMQVDGYNWQPSWSSSEQKLAIWADLAIRGASPEKHGYWWSEGYRMLADGRCCRCNRKLTHPESIEFGIGPECAKKIGG